MAPDTPNVKPPDLWAWGQLWPKGVKKQTKEVRKGNKYHTSEAYEKDRRKANALGEKVGRSCRRGT